MKKSLLLSTLLCASLSGFSQEAEINPSQIPSLTNPIELQGLRMASVIYQEDSTANYNWDKGLGEWKNSNTYAYKFSSEGKVIEYRIGSSTKLIYSYDNQGRVQEIVIESWDNSLNAFVPFSKNVYSYELGNKFNSGNQSYTYDPTTKQWDISGRTTMQYDDVHGAMSLMKYETYSNGNWVPDYEFSYEYNADGKITKYKYLNFWDEAISDWGYGTLTEYTYESKKVITQGFIWSKKTKSWVNNGLTTTSYSGQNTESITQEWDNTLSQWVNVTKESYEKDANDNVLVKIEQEWENDQWVNDIKTVNTFDQNNNKLTSTSSSWDDTANEWKTSSEDEYTYTSAGNPLTTISYSYYTGVKTPLTKIEYSYINVDGATLITQTVTNDLEEIKTGYISYSWNENTQTWENSSKQEIFISEFSGKLVSLENAFENESSIEVFPNPSSDYIKINLEENIGTVSLTLINTQGVVVKSVDAYQSGDELSLLGLNDGQYLLKISDGENQIVQKVIKK